MTAAELEAREAQRWMDYFTPLQPCRCEDVQGPHMLTDLHPDD